MKSKHMLILATTAAALSANAQVTLPYNPDGDANGLIGVTDLQDLLSTYGGEFAPGRPMLWNWAYPWILSNRKSQRFKTIQGMPSVAVTMCFTKGIGTTPRLSVVNAGLPKT